MLIGQISYKVMSHDHDLTRFRVLGILIIFLMSYLHDLGYIYLHDIPYNGYFLRAANFY